MLWWEALNKTALTLTISPTILIVLTIDFISIHFSVHHPVRLEHHIFGQRPAGLFMWVQNGFPRYAIAQEDYSHDYHNIKHVGHLQEMTHIRVVRLSFSTTFFRLKLQKLLFFLGLFCLFQSNSWFQLLGKKHTSYVYMLLKVGCASKGCTNTWFKLHHEAQYIEHMK